MALTSPRNKILPLRGLKSALDANLAEILEGEICYATDEDQYYQNEGGVLVAVGATKAQGTLADSAIQPGDNISTLTLDVNGQPISTTVVDGDIDLDANGAGLIQVTEFNLSQVPIVTQHDIGTGANEVPLNGMLGGMAFQDPAAVTVNDLIISNGVLVADLPNGPIGKIARVTDATTPAVGSTVTGGGAAPALCWYNGTNWTVLGV